MDAAFWRARDDAPEGMLSTAARRAWLEPANVAVDDRPDVGRMPVSMLAPTAVSVAAGLALTVFAGPIFGSSRRAADRRRLAQYISVVLTP